MSGFAIRITGQVPSKKNSKRIFRNNATGRPFITSSLGYLAWHDANLADLKNIQQDTYSGPLEITLTFYNIDRRRHDLDNMASSVLDLLSDAGVIEDDTCEVVTELVLKYGGVDKTNPRVEILIKGMGSDD